MEKIRGSTSQKKIQQHSTVSTCVASKQVDFLIVSFNYRVNLLLVMEVIFCKC